MKGNVGVTSDEGKGSTFWIELPAAAATNAKTGGSANSAAKA
jgi:signal transduction histidine kinase